MATASTAHAKPFPEGSPITFDIDETAMCIVRPEPMRGPCTEMAPEILQAARNIAPREGLVVLGVAVVPDGSTPATVTVMRGTGEGAGAELPAPEAYRERVQRTLAPDLRITTAAKQQVDVGRFLTLDLQSPEEGRIRYSRAAIFLGTATSVLVTATTLRSADRARDVAQLFVSMAQGSASYVPVSDPAWISSEGGSAIQRAHEIGEALASILAYGPVAVIGVLAVWYARKRNVESRRAREARARADRPSA